ncbi:alpha/beta fold hydrolase [Steroidobacter sp.]|uniref:alpha/beta fold hydrolase n=1 Tax=Steroidobacter sp. TaxID=1978227 RepID=UPI001A573AC3|nr:alpha/beta hydrolase [Steroidobacter sp.]MBL8265402.1 alpha/beta hydrolase [Steroidobacter sp.]
MSFDRVRLIARLTTIAMVCSLALTGCSSAPPPPGQMVDIGGRSLHLYCTGPQDAKPTVIIEGGLGEMSPSYHWVQAGVSQQTRVCSYDRAGLGWSDDSPEPRDAEHMVHDLHELLKAAHVGPPYVLAGHSLGGLLILGYTRRYPEEVAGLVFLDSSHPEQKARLPDYERNERWGKRIFSAMKVAAHLGVTGLLRSQFKDEWFDEFPPEVQTSLSYFVSNPRIYDTGRAELDYFDVDASDAAQVTSLGDLPLVVLTAGRLKKHSDPEELAHAQAYVKIFSELHAKYAALSSRGRHVILPEAGHISLVGDKRHAQDVVKNILEVVAEARASGGPTQ